MPRKSNWLGTHYSQESLCDVPGIHILRSGSNSAITGFPNMKAAVEWKHENAPGLDWSIKDLRDSPIQPGRILEKFDQRESPVDGLLMLASFCSDFFHKADISPSLKAESAAWMMDFLIRSEAGPESGIGVFQLESGYEVFVMVPGHADICFSPKGVSVHPAGHYEPHFAEDPSEESRRIFESAKHAFSGDRDMSRTIFYSVRNALKDVSLKEPQTMSPEP